MIFNPDDPKTYGGAIKTRADYERWAAAIKKLGTDAEPSASLLSSEETRLLEEWAAAGRELLRTHPEWRRPQIASEDVGNVLG